MRYWKIEETNLMLYYFIGIIYTIFYGWKIHLILAPTILLAILVISIFNSKIGRKNK